MTSTDVELAGTRMSQVKGMRESNRRPSNGLMVNVGQQGQWMSQRVYFLQGLYHTFLLFAAASSASRSCCSSISSAVFFSVYVLNATRPPNTTVIPIKVPLYFLPLIPSANPPIFVRVTQLKKTCTRINRTKHVDYTGCRWSNTLVSDSFQAWIRVNRHNYKTTMETKNH